MKLTLFTLLVLGYSVLLPAQQTQGALNNGRICNLVAAGVSIQEVLRIIATAPKIDFDLRPESTAAMLQFGVSEDVIKAMAGRESGSTVQTAAPVADYQPTAVVRATETPRPMFEAAKSTGVVIYQGTPVRMRIMRTVSSADAQVGNNVDFQTLDDIQQNGIVVIPKGSTAIATITAAESKKRVARGGKLGMNIDYVRLPNGEQLPLRGVQNLKGGGHTGVMTGGIVASAIVFWPAAPFFLLMHGKDVMIPEGHEVTVYTNTEYRF